MCLGYDLEQQGSGMGPSRQIIEAHGLTVINDLMGLSCLLFLTSPIVYVLYRHKSDHKTAKFLTLWIAWLMAAVALFSFLSDYWVAENDECDAIWHFLFSVIDWSLSGACILAGIVLTIYQLVFTPKARPLSTAVLAICVVAFYVKVGCAVWHYDQYFETGPVSWTQATPGLTPSGKRWTTQDYLKCADFSPVDDPYLSGLLKKRRQKQALHIWWANFCHALWHVIMSMAPAATIYCLLVHGMGDLGRRSMTASLAEWAVASVALESGALELIV